LEIAREEDNLEEELGYRVPGLNGLEGADAEDVQLGWLVNASAVRFIRILFFFFVCFFVRERDRDTKAQPEGKFKNFQTFTKRGQIRESAFVSRV
jgi:Na+/melibiose symporter-like transporter